MASLVKRLFLLSIYIIGVWTSSKEINNTPRGKESTESDLVDGDKNVTAVVKPKGSGFDEKKRSNTDKLPIPRPVTKEKTLIPVKPKEKTLILVKPKGVSLDKISPNNKEMSSVKKPSIPRSLDKEKVSTAINSNKIGLNKTSSKLPLPRTEKETSNEKSFPVSCQIDGERNAPTVMGSKVVINNENRQRSLLNLVKKITSDTQNFIKPSLVDNKKKAPIAVKLVSTTFSKPPLKNQPLPPTKKLPIPKKLIDNKGKTLDPNETPFNQFLPPTERQKSNAKKLSIPRQEVDSNKRTPNVVESKIVNPNEMSMITPNVQNSTMRYPTRDNNEKMTQQTDMTPKEINPKWTSFGSFMDLAAIDDYIDSPILPTEINPYNTQNSIKPSIVKKKAPSDEKPKDTTFNKSPLRKQLLPPIEKKTFNAKKLPIPRQEVDSNKNISNVVESKIVNPNEMPVTKLVDIANVETLNVEKSSTRSIMVEDKDTLVKPPTLFIEKDMPSKQKPTMPHLMNRKEKTQNDIGSKSVISNKMSSDSILNPIKTKMPNIKESIVSRLVDNKKEESIKPPMFPIEINAPNMQNSISSQNQQTQTGINPREQVYPNDSMYNPYYENNTNLTDIVDSATKDNNRVVEFDQSLYKSMEHQDMIPEKILERNRIILYTLFNHPNGNDSLLLPRLDRIPGLRTIKVKSMLEGLLFLNGMLTSDIINLYMSQLVLFPSVSSKYMAIDPLWIDPHKRNNSNAQNFTLLSNATYLWPLFNKTGEEGGHWSLFVIKVIERQLTDDYKYYGHGHFMEDVHGRFKIDKHGRKVYIDYYDFLKTKGIKKGRYDNFVQVVDFINEKTDCGFTPYAVYGRPCHQQVNEADCGISTLITARNLVVGNFVNPTKKIVPQLSRAEIAVELTTAILFTKLDETN